MHKEDPPAKKVKASDASDNGLTTQHAALHVPEDISEVASNDAPEDISSENQNKDEIVERNVTGDNILQAAIFGARNNVGAGVEKEKFMLGLVNSMSKVDERKDKKTLKMLKKEQLKEAHLEELVDTTLVPSNDIQNMKNKQKSEKPHSADALFIAQISLIAQKENRKNKELKLVNKKMKKLTKQESETNFTSHAAMNETYPLHSSSHSALEEGANVRSGSLLPTQTHVIYKHIMSHGLNVAKYARTLFLGLEPLHCLPDIWLERLVLAAQYHDVGVIDGAKSHHKYSYTRIKADRGINIPDGDRDIVALLARYHRRAMPSPKHEEFAELSIGDKEKFCKVAAILRLADALDYGHHGAIQDVEVHINKSSVTLRCHSQESILQEAIRVQKKGNLFRRSFKKEIECEQM